MAVRHVQASLRVQRREVRDPERPIDGAVGEPLDPAGAHVQPEDGRVPLIADEEMLAAPIERHPEAEAVGGRDLLDRPPVRIEPEDLSALAAAPHAAVRMDRDALGVVELGIVQGPVEEHRDPVVREQHPHPSADRSEARHAAGPRAPVSTG